MFALSITKCSYGQNRTACSNQNDMKTIDEYTWHFLKERMPPERTDAFKARRRKYAEILGVSEKHIDFVLQKKRHLSTEKAEQLARFFGYSHLDMLNEGRDLAEGKKSEARPSVRPEIIVQNVSRFQTFDSSFASEQYIPIRLLGGRAAAGPPGEIIETDIESWILIYAAKEWMPNDPEHYTCVKVAGQSMWPILNDGDIVAIDHAQRDPRELDGKMAVFRIEDGVTIKWLKFHRKKNIVVGIPQNKDELDYVVMFQGDEIDSGIVGKVAWWWAKR